MLPSGMCVQYQKGYNSVIKMEEDFFVSLATHQNCFTKIFHVTSTIYFLPCKYSMFVC